MRLMCMAVGAMVLVSIGLVPLSSLAQGLPPPNIVLGEGYATGPEGWVPLESWPEVGDELMIVGRITSFEDFALDVPAPSDSFEYTYAMKHLVVRYTENRLYVGLSGGEVRIFADSSPDADYLNPETFEDGEVVLDGSCTRMDLWLPFVGREFVAYFVFVDGQWFSHLRGDRDHVPVLIGGTFACCDIPQALRNYGYVARAQLGLTFLEGVAVETTTWGRIKALLDR